MKKPRRPYLSAIMFVVPILIIIATACEKRNFETDSTYAEEMQRFILEDSDGKELFHAPVLSEEAFLYDSTSNLHFYRVDSSKRKIEIVIGDSLKNIPPYAGIFDALGIVRDILYGKLYRIIGSDTLLAYKMIDSLTRYAYFLKLYNDNYEYRGWRFYGFIGGRYQPYLIPRARRLSGSDGQSIAADPPPAAPPNPYDTLIGYYILDDSVPKMPLGDSVTFVSNTRDLIFRIQTDSLYSPGNTALQGVKYSTGWRLPESASRFYHLVLIDLPGRFATRVVGPRVDSTLIKTNDYFIPFKIDI